MVRYALEKNIEITTVTWKEQVHWCLIAPVGDKPKFLRMKCLVNFEQEVQKIWGYLMLPGIDN